MTITRKIDRTTDRVVSRPTLSALRDTVSPAWQPTSAIVAAKNGAFKTPTQKVHSPIAPCSWRRKSGGAMPSSSQAHQPRRRAAT